jgi:hypothetical protein
MSSEISKASVESTRESGVSRAYSQIIYADPTGAAESADALVENTMKGLRAAI